MGQPTLAQALGLTREQALAAFSAARTVVEADGPALGARSAQLLDVLGRALELGDARPAAGSVDLAAAFPSPQARRALADALVLAACIEGEVTGARQAAASAIARQLGVRSHWVDLLDALRRRNAFAVKRALMSRSPDARRLFSRTWAEEGVMGIVRAFVFMLGLHRDGALAARYRALGALPRGSFGRAVADHFEARKLAFPGERGGMPERMIHHDLMHVINEYDTDPAGECQLAGFYAGCADGDAFTFFVIVLATFHLGLSGVSPAAVTPAKGAFDPERVLAAYLRGRRLRVDVMGPWDYWGLMPLPVAEVRERLGIGESGHGELAESATG
jgi:hypothetical protein